MQSQITNRDPPFDEWTPKQLENWENVGSKIYQNIEKICDVLVDGDDWHADAETVQEWYLRIYRPKKRGDGMMERDRVKTGNPEKFVTAVMEKFFNPWGSIYAVMMHSMSVRGDDKDTLMDVAILLAVTKAETHGRRKALARICREHDRVAALYGVDDD